jgi:hypothetical protein
MDLEYYEDIRRHDQALAVVQLAVVRYGLEFLHPLGGHVAFEDLMTLVKLSTPSSPGDL